MDEYLIEKLTSSRFSEKGLKVALVAVGSTETHGPHLPLSTDTYVAYEIAKAVAKQVKNAFVAPPLFFGMSEHYRQGAFFISLKPEHLISVLTDIFDSIYSNGITRIVVINGHDGNIAPLEVAGRDFKVHHRDVVIAVLEKWWKLPGKVLPKGFFDVWEGLGHAGEGETSMCLHLFPELVEMKKAKGRVPYLPENLDVKWDFSELTDTVATGDPTKATAEKGKKMMEVVVDAVVSFIKEMDEKKWVYGFKAL